MDSINWKLVFAICSNVLLLTTANPAMNINQLRPSNILHGRLNPTALENRNNGVVFNPPQSRILNPFLLFNWFGKLKNQNHKSLEDACQTDPCFDLPHTICDASTKFHYDCVCEVGYVPARNNNPEVSGCVDDPCKPNPCRGPDSFCYRRNSTEFGCACKPGYSPINYNSVANGCEKDPCLFKRPANITSITCQGCAYSNEATDDSSCQNTFAQLPMSFNQGRITSPNYPNEYEDDLCLEYVITVDECSFIRATVYDIEIEAHNDCEDDGLILREGNSVGGPVIAQLCPEEFFNAGLISYDTVDNELYVRFYTDSDDTYFGFQLGFEGIPKNGYQ